MRGMRRRDLSLLIVLILSLGGCATSAPGGGALWQEGAAGAVPAEIARLNDHLGQLAERLKPGLVQVRVQRAQPPAGEGEEGVPPDEPRRTSGSGFLIREDGLVVTNAHVIADATRIQIRQIGRAHV